MPDLSMFAAPAVPTLKPPARRARARRRIVQLVVACCISLLASVALCAVAPAAHAAARKKPATSKQQAAPKQPTASKTPSGSKLDQLRTRFREAYALAERGPGDRWRARADGLEDYPLYPYLEQAALERDLNHADAAELRAFLARYPDTPFGTTLRRAYLKQLARDSHWSEFLALYVNDDDPELRCDEVAARSSQDPADTALPEKVRGLLLSGRHLPAACAEVERIAGATGLLTSEFVWQRIGRAAEARQFAQVSEFAADLPEAERAEALRYAALLGDPARHLGEVAGWTDTARARGMIARALARLAQHDSAAAGQQWLALEPHFAWSEAERATALGGIALERASSYTPDAAEWIGRIPDSGFDQRLAEWRLREALARSDWPAALRALARLDVIAPNESRVRYWHARVAELSGDANGARAGYSLLARDANYFGFLAAERAAQPYALCPRDATVSAQVRAHVAAQAGLARAFELRAIGWDGAATREWDYTLRSLAADDRIAAVAEAQARGWNERGPFTLVRPEEQRLYTLRFPLAHQDLITRSAERNQVEPELVLGVIRTESAWVEDAVSSAKARGLMQVLPEVAPQLAKLEKIKYPGAAALDRPELNVALGTRQLGDVISHYKGRTWVALAAYNAGPAPVGRWLAARGDMPPDLWVETIPYRETREYVERVLAFAAIYGWRRDGRALALPGALAGIAADPAKPGTERRDVTCPVPLAAGSSP
jgi:soluble lytic murein transglycosylase